MFYDGIILSSLIVPGASAGRKYKRLDALYLIITAQHPLMPSNVESLQLPK